MGASKTPVPPLEADFEDAAARAKLGLWQYDEPEARFRGSEVVQQILGLDVTTGADVEAVSALYVGDSLGRLSRAIDLALKEGTPFTFVAEIETPSGGRKWIRTQGQVAEGEGSGSRRVFGTMQDISEIRLLDRVTQESELTLNQVEQITHIGHWSVNPIDGSFYHSDEIKRIFGYEPSEYALSVEDAINAYHPDDRDKVIDLFNRAVATGEGYEFDLRIVQPSGDIRQVHSKGYTEQDEAGAVTRVYGVFQDITEQVRAERALRESEASMKALIDVVHTGIVVHDENGEVLLSNQMANRLLAPLAAEVVGKDLADPAYGSGNRSVRGTRRQKPLMRARFLSIGARGACRRTTGRVCCCHRSPGVPVALAPPVPGPLGILRFETLRQMSNASQERPLRIASTQWSAPW